MDRRITKTSVVSIVITLIIIILVMGADVWFGIDLGMFKWVIFGVAVVAVNCVVVSQARKVEKYESLNNTTLRNGIKSTEEQKKDTLVLKPIIAIVLVIVGTAILAIFYLNVFGLNLPEWAFLSALIGFPLVIWGVSSLVLTYRKQK